MLYCTPIWEYVAILYPGLGIAVLYPYLGLTVLYPHMGIAVLYPRREKAVRYPHCVLALVLNALELPRYNLLVIRVGCVLHYYGGV